MLYEVNREAARNLDVIRANIDRYVARRGGAADEPAPRMIIDRLEFTGGRVQTDASAMGLEPRGVDLPGFSLSDLGAPDGAPADAIAKQALARLARQAVESMARSEVADLQRDRLDNGLGDQAPDEVKEQADQLLDRLGGSGQPRRDRVRPDRRVVGINAPARLAAEIPGLPSPWGSPRGRSTRTSRHRRPRPGPSP